MILDDCEVKIVAMWLEAELRLGGIRCRLQERCGKCKVKSWENISL